MIARDESDAVACYREMARNLAPGLARAPWDERDDAAALDAADAREAQRAIDDGETDAAPALCLCGVAVPRSALDRVLFRFLLIGGVWACPACREVSL